MPTLLGALFAEVFGTTVGRRRSTVVLVLLSGLVFSGLRRAMRTSRERSPLGTAAYLVNPIPFVISYSFMSDPRSCAEGGEPPAMS
jgi:hypothetical protein